MTFGVRFSWLCRITIYLLYTLWVVDTRHYPTGQLWPVIKHTFSLTLPCKLQKKIYDRLFQRITNIWHNIWIWRGREFFVYMNITHFFFHFIKIRLYCAVLYRGCSDTRCLGTLFYTFSWKFNNQWTN